MKNNKPKCKLIGEDGNIFNLMAIASKELRRNNMKDKTTEMCDKINSEAQSYYDALAILGEYVDIV